ncbi:probable cytochrome P450 6d5 [Contarinia nasturtii]|uniref:probable cytochrome P450 6d5 n=1 Tax=Contarinia nasturtii TaxID=265458 RepID=UPI0012D416C7|nr:probable cytochrome P450 6d5 [Contarinia nasturtii]
MLYQSASDNNALIIIYFDIYLLKFVRFISVASKNSSTKVKMAHLTGSWKVDVLSLIIVILTLVYLFLKRTYSYWDRNGFKSLSDASLLFGHFKAGLTQKESIGLFFWRVYRTTTEPFLGVYGIMRPILFVKDPQLVRTILIKDFAHFSDRGVHCNEDYDPLSAHLFALPGKKWKNMRAKLTPTFTSGKLKAMFSTIVNCGSTLHSYLDNLVSENEPLHIREISARHSTNIIASVAFGIDVDCINNPDNEFRENGRKFFASTFMNGIRFFIRFIAPKLMPILRIKGIPSDVEDFIKTLVKQNLEYREKNNYSRKDFFQLLIQLRNGGTVQLDDEWSTVIKADENQKTLTLNEICAQALIFYVAGFETSSTTLSYCLYELAKHPDIQDRVHKEIDTVLNKHNGQLTYETVLDMIYLEKCIEETLRKYPVLPMINRKCVKEYRIPGTDNVIEEGVEVYMSVIGMHRDEQFYDEPNKFDPMRLDDEVGKNLVNRPYIPFGDGPRNCIGMRLGKLQTKVGLISMLQNFNYELDERHKGGDLEFDPRHFLLQPSEDIFLRVSKRVTS